MEQPLISLILPVYGVEDYLEECIQSVVHQTYENIEIILVDDGSKDRCPQIIDEWAAKDARIRAIHKENGGLSSARNAGMEQAKGEYITFIDSDDWVEPNYCASLYETLKSCDADMAVGFVMKVKGNEKTPIILDVEPNIPYYTAQAAKPLLEQSIAVWGKMYRSALVQDLRFPEGRLAEDAGFLMTALRKSEIVSFCNDHLYDYRIRESSIAHSIKPQYLLDNILAMDEVHRICRESFQNEVPFCTGRLAALIYEFKAAKAYGDACDTQRPDILVNALKTVGGEFHLIKKMETPLGTICYTYNQFYPYLTRKEKRKLQKDYRRCFTLRAARQYGRLFWVKYLPCWFSLALMRRIVLLRTK